MQCVVYILVIKWEKKENEFVYEEIERITLT